MIPDSIDNFGSGRTDARPRLSARDYEAISTAFNELKELGVESFTSLESYIEWYRNVFGQLALEMLIEDCKKALRDKDYKKMLAIVATLATAHRQTLDTPAPVKEELEIETPPLTLGEIELLLSEYEKYFDEIEMGELVADEIEKVLNEDRFISFEEVSNLVNSVESHLANLVNVGELTEDQAQEIIIELKDIEVGKFCSLSAEELEATMSELPFLTVDEIKQLVQNFELRENIEINEAAKMFGEDGFLDLGADIFNISKSNAELTFAEIQGRASEFEAKLVELVESGKISSDQAYELRDKFRSAPIELTPEIAEAAISTMNNDELSTPQQVEIAVSQFVDKDFNEIVAQLEQDQNFESPITVFDEVGVETISENLINDSVDPVNQTAEPTIHTVEQAESSQAVEPAEVNQITQDMESVVVDSDAPSTAFDEAGFVSVSDLLKNDSIEPVDLAEDLTTIEALEQIQFAPRTHDTDPSLQAFLQNEAEDRFSKFGVPTYQQSRDFDFSDTENLTTIKALEQIQFTPITQEMDPSVQAFIQNESKDRFSKFDIPTYQQDRDFDFREDEVLTSASTGSSASASTGAGATVSQSTTQSVTTPTATPTPTIFDSRTAQAANPVQHQVAENFVPVNLFVPGTRPSETPSFTPAQNLNTAPNLVTQPQSFAKPDVPAQQQTQQQQQPQQQPQLRQEPQETVVGPRPNEPEETNFNKGPCIECNKMSCEQCNVRPNADQLKEQIQARTAARMGGVDPISPGVAPNMVSPGMQPVARGIESRVLSQSGLVR